MRDTRARTRAIAAIVAGVVLILLAFAIVFWWPQLRWELGEIALLTAVGVRLAALFGGVSLLAYGWSALRPREAAPAQE